MGCGARSYRALFRELLAVHRVPLVYQFALQHRLRLAAVIDSYDARIRWNRCRLLAIATLGPSPCPEESKSALKSADGLASAPDARARPQSTLARRTRRSSRSSCSSPRSPTSSPACSRPRPPTTGCALLPPPRRCPFQRLTSPCGAVGGAQHLQTYTLFVLTGMANPYERARLSSVLSSLRAAASHGVLSTLLRRVVASALQAPADDRKGPWRCPPRKVSTPCSDENETPLFACHPSALPPPAPLASLSFPPHPALSRSRPPLAFSHPSFPLPPLPPL